MIRRDQAATPRTHPTAFVEASARGIGDVVLAEDASVWLCTVLRADANVIRVGRGSNLQDGTVMHVNRRGQPTIRGDFVTVGHAARLHGRRIASHDLSPSLPATRSRNCGILGGCQSTGSPSISKRKCFGNVHT